MITKPPAEYRFDLVAQDPHPLMRLLAIEEGLEVLDVGCGQGYWANRIQLAGGRVTGIDIDPDALGVAGELGVGTRLIDARHMDYDADFDVAFTNAALHWMKPIRSVVLNVSRALRPGGRFVGEFGGHGNIATIRVALRHSFAKAGLNFDDYDPWEFPATVDFCDLLQECSFDISHIETFPRDTPLPSGCVHWLEHFMANIFAGLPDGKGEQIKHDTAEVLRGITSSGDTNWTADYVRLRFSAQKS